MLTPPPCMNSAFPKQGHLQRLAYKMALCRVWTGIFHFNSGLFIFMVTFYLWQRHWFPFTERWRVSFQQYSDSGVRWIEVGMRRWLKTLVEHVLSPRCGSLAEPRSRGEEAVRAAGAPEGLQVWGIIAGLHSGAVAPSQVSRPAEDEEALGRGTWAPQWTWAGRGGAPAPWGCRHKGPELGLALRDRHGL